jgi:HrpA-like RNA helicase
MSNSIMPRPLSQSQLTTTLPRIPNTAKMHDNGLIEIASTGAARRKKHAEYFAAVDLLLHLQQECGIDVHNPPSIRQQLEAQKKAQEELEYKEKLEQAKMLLEWCNVSKHLQFDTNPSRGEKWVSDVLLQCKGKFFLVTGALPGRSKAVAEGNALIAASKSKELEEIVGRERIETYRALLQKSPAQHVATLHVPPLPTEATLLLEDAIGDDHEERMKHHARTKAQREERFRAALGDEHVSRKRRGRALNDREQTSQAFLEEEESRLERALQDREQTSQAFLEEEESRLERALQDPNGKPAAMKAIRDALPIKSIQNELVETLRSEQVVVVSGGTGSGKSTQCPQYILEDAILGGKGAETRVVVTQPRRIAAISVAERIADERNEQIGNSVGYSVRFNQQAPRKTGGSIEFVTTGVLLRRLVKDPALEGVSHVMIDEVHEQDLDTDFLLILLRDLLAVRPDLRVILMSATLDADKFAVYFSSRGKKRVPMLSVPAKPRHPVEIVHLEDLAGEKSTKRQSMAATKLPFELQALAKSLLDFHDAQIQLELEEADAEEEAATKLEARSLAEDEGRCVDDSDSDSDNEEEDSGNRMSVASVSRAETLRHAVSKRAAASGSSIVSTTRRNLKADKREIGDITVALLAQIAQYIARVETDSGRAGSILCFLPGWDEINQAMALLEESDPLLKQKMLILPLHSSIPQSDQQKVFEPAADGTVKVILATNIAESSVTINDVLSVIDTGLVREMNFDAESGMSTMETVPTSKASATQRLGRAGRVAPGKCYRLYSRGALHAMFEQPTPEIQRTALEATCLQTCSMTRESVESFLQRAMDPPRADSIIFAMDRLVKLGAIGVNPDDGSQTLLPLGRCLSRLPVDPSTGRMLIMGCVMQCLDPVLTAAACFSSRGLFYIPPGMRDQQREIRKGFCNTSDLLATVRAFDELEYRIQEDGWQSARQWASDHFISLAAVNTIRSVRSQLLNELKRIGLVHKNDLVNYRSKKKELRVDASVNRNTGVESLHIALWASGLPDNLASRREIESFGTLRTRSERHAGLHPSSVAFHRRPPRHTPTPLPSWFLYREMAMTSQVFLRDCTALRPEQIVLFGGYSLDQVDRDYRMANAYEASDSNDSTVRVLDEWIVLEGSCNDTMDLLANARQSIEAALDLKAMDPRKPLPEALQFTVDAVCDVFDILEQHDSKRKRTVRRE